MIRMRTALSSDIPALQILINRAYRGESSRLGWTSEADLLGGLRIDGHSLEQILADPDSRIFIALKDDLIVASIHAHRISGTVHFGLFAVEPSMQGNGIGSELLHYAETTVFKLWQIPVTVMEVITLRSELIAFYERHGYIRTGEIIPFPSSTLWELKVPYLEMSVLTKQING